MTDDLPFHAAEEKWAPQIGKFILDFVCIEDSIYEVVLHYVNTTLIHEEALSQKFATRISLFQKILKEKILEDEADIKLLNKSVSSIHSLLPTRNLIAHNSLKLVFEDNEDGELVERGFEISGRKKPENSITYADLCEKVLKLNQCRQDFLSLMMKFEKYRLLKADIFVKELDSLK